MRDAQQPLHPAHGKRQQQDPGQWSVPPKKMRRLDSEEEGAGGKQVQLTCLGSVGGKDVAGSVLGSQKTGGVAVQQPWEASQRSSGCVQEKEVEILDTMTVVLTSCPISLFTQLLQHLISLMVSASLSSPFFCHSLVSASLSSPFFCHSLCSLQLGFFHLKKV